MLTTTPLKLLIYAQWILPRFFCSIIYFLLDLSFFFLKNRMFFGIFLHKLLENTENDAGKNHLPANPEFGSCPKLWTAPQSDFSHTLIEKKWHALQLLNVNQYFKNDTVKLLLSIPGYLEDCQSHHAKDGKNRQYISYYSVITCSISSVYSQCKAKFRKFKVGKKCQVKLRCNFSKYPNNACEFRITAPDICQMFQLEKFYPHFRDMYAAYTL